VLLFLTISFVKAQVCAGEINGILLYINNQNQLSIDPQNFAVSIALTYHVRIKTLEKHYDSFLDYMRWKVFSLVTISIF